MDEQLRIEVERPEDVEGVRAVNAAAFGQATEGAIVDALRDGGALTISLVAREDGVIVGHVAFSPVTASKSPAKILGLGPLAVLPSEQRRGIGSALIRAGLARAKADGCDGVVVLGHPEYYGRFGFAAASRFGMQCEYDVPADVFMAIELTPAGLSDCAGLVRDHAAFALAAP